MSEGGVCIRKTKKKKKKKKMMMNKMNNNYYYYYYYLLLLLLYNNNDKVSHTQERQKVACQIHRLPASLGVLVQSDGG